MTALYFASYAVGSFMGVFILKFISSRSYVYLTYITSIGSVILFYVGIHWAISPLQTIPIAAIGIATSAIMPTVFTWTQEAITPVSGIISSAFYFSGSVASLLNPILFAYLIESITPMWFIYATIVEILLCFALCIIGDIINRIRKF